MNAGPVATGPATGIRPEVFIHAARFEDWNGTMPDGARIARRRAGLEKVMVALRRPGGGFTEERPGRIVIDVTCVSGALKQVQLIAALASPVILLALERMPDPALAALDSAGARLRFAEFTVALHQCVTSRQTGDRVPVFEELLTFHLDGFLHVAVKQNPPAAAKPAPKPTPKPSPKPPAKPATKTQARKAKRTKKRATAPR